MPRHKLRDQYTGSHEVLGQFGERRLPNDDQQPYAVTKDRLLLV